MTVRLLCVVAGLMSLSCGQSADSGAAGIFFPRHSVSGPMPAALVEGHLEVRDGCVWIVDTQGTRLLAIWPSGWHVRAVDGRIQVVSADGRITISDGDRVKGGGGQTVTADNAHRFMGQTEPAACRTGAFWLVAQLVRVPASPEPSPTDDTGAG